MTNTSRSQNDRNRGPNPLAEAAESLETQLEPIEPLHFLSAQTGCMVDSKERRLPFTHPLLELIETCVLYFVDSKMHGQHDKYQQFQPK